jgi:hypothetical protein
VIGAFAALAEVAMVVAVILGEGNIRWAALVLAALFFFGIAGPFFYILAERSHVFYPPRDYGSPSVSDYADAVLRRPTVQLPHPSRFLPAVEAQIRESVLKEMLEFDRLVVTIEVKGCSDVLREHNNNRSGAASRSWALCGPASA